MHTRASLVLAGAALLLAGTAAGIALGRWTSAAPAQKRGFEDASTQVLDLSPALADLRRAIDELRSDLRLEWAAPSAAESSREPSPVPSADAARLAAAVERLNQLLEARISESVSREGRRERMGLGFPTLQALQERIASMGRLAESGRETKLAAELTSAHALWSREDVFERYGTPTRLDATGGTLKLLYSDPSGSSAPTVWFDTAEGLVTAVYWY